MDKIKVTVSHHRYFIYEAQDVQRLRKDFRIVGRLIGYHPEVGADALPLSLSKFEAKLLLEEDIIQLLEVVHNPDDSTKDNCKKVIEDFKKEAEVEVKKVVIEDKKKKIIANSEAVLTKHRRRNPDSHNLTDQDILQQVLSRAENEVAVFHLPVQTFVKTPFEGLLRPITTNIELSPSESFKYEVFKTLWSKKFFLTEGDQFACDFLVYDHDPFVCHSKFMVICRSDEPPSLPSLEMVLKGRLSVQVNKELIIAYPTSSGNVAFMSVKWEGQKSKVHK